MFRPFRYLKERIETATEIEMQKLEALRGIQSDMHTISVALLETERCACDGTCPSIDKQAHGGTAPAHRKKRRAGT